MSSTPEEDPTPNIKSEPWDRESHIPRLYQITPETSDEVKEIPKEEEPQDCLAARMAALEIDRQAPGAGTYVPECTHSGDYTRVQCHRSPPYCWCVHPRTGRPIRGTATHGVKPDCDSAKTKTKNFKGCSMHKKQEFLDELIKSFSKEMQEDAQNKSMNIDAPTPEKAARWKFSSADTNSNAVLDKREWKIFKTEWRTLQKDGRVKRRLRKCWRNLPRFCDENGNQKITLDEWLACTVTTRDSKTSLPRNHRRGKNPLTTILKSD